MNLKNLQSVVLFVTLFTFITFVNISCKKDPQPTASLVEDSFKDFNTISGMATHIKVSGSDWIVEYVKLEDKQINLLDSSGQALRLDGQDTVYSANGWLRMAKSENGAELFVRLKENFEQTPRTVVIGLNANGQKDEIKIIQHRASGYKIVDRKITELEEFRKKYTSDHECSPLQLINNSSEVKSMATEQIFQNVKHVSTFESDDYGAFEWIGAQQDSLLFMQELLVDGGHWWSPPVKYKKGTTQTFYLDENNSRTHFNVDPYRKMELSGKMTYIERVCQYTFTIQNEQSGHRFDVSGIWKQTLPLSTTIVIESNNPIVSTGISNNADHAD